jgi:hypothetical protein
MAVAMQEKSEDFSHPQSSSKKPHLFTPAELKHLVSDLTIKNASRTSGKKDTRF